MTRSSGISTEGWTALWAGALLAAVALWLPLASFVLSYFSVLVHEMGHALMGWIYGYPSLPAFDFVYGGGVTSHTQRAPALALGVQGALLGVAWVVRRNPAGLMLALGSAALYALTAWTPLHEPLIVAMGPGAELVVSAVFLHRGLSGRTCHHRAERFAYAFLGWFVILDNLRFAHRLLTSAFQREIYAEAKGGGHWMDFSVLAEQHLHVALEQVAALFLILCLLAPTLAVLGNWNRRTLAAAILELRRL